MAKGYWAVDLDGTLVEYDYWRGADHIGAPVPKMVERVKMWLQQGRDVRIFTARVWPIGLDPFPIVQELGATEYNRRIKEAHFATATINKFCFEQFGRALPAQCWKDYSAVEIWDDRAVQVIPNTGLRADGRDTNQ